MRVAFLSLEAREPLAYGLMSLAASLRRHGHEVSTVTGRDATALGRDPRVLGADALALSATTGLHRVAVAWARELRVLLPDKAILLGGPHATFFPEVIDAAPFDGVCIGEAEESLPELLDASRGGLEEAPAGWWIRRDRGRGPVVKGPLRPPPQDLDALPPPAFDLYYDADPRYRRLPIRVFLASRGCPHGCTYCFNRTLNARSRGRGPKVRCHDPDRVADDIERVVARWGGRLVWFLDANFAARRPWLEAFLGVYRRRIGLPFFCKLRPERASAETARLLAAAGCTAVGVGIESGSERIRREVLGRRVTDGAILEGCRQLKARGIRILAFNMLGIPGETFDEALRTVALNVACRVDYGGATIFQPYPATVLGEEAVRQGLFHGDFDRLGYSYFDASPLAYPSRRDRDRVTCLQRLFALAVELPEVRSRLWRLVDLGPRRLLDHLFMARHDWAMQHTFYRAFRRGLPTPAGSPEALTEACEELGIASPRVRAS